MLRAQIIQTLITRVLLMGAGVLASIVTARYLGPEGRGEYFFAITLAALISQLANLGLHASNTYYVAKRPEMLPSLVSNSLWVSLCLGCGSALVVMAVIRSQGWFPQAQDSTLLIAGLIAPFSLYYMLSSNLLVGMGKIASFNLIEAAARIMPLVLMLLAGYFGLGVSGFLGATLFAAAAVSVAVLLMLLKSGSSISFWSASAFRETINYGFRAYIAALLAFGISRLNVFWLQHYSGSSDLGYFSIAVQFGDALALLPASISLVLLPRLIKQQNNNTMRHTLKMVGVAMTGLCGTIGVCAGWVVPALFGDAFKPATEILYWYLPSVVCLGLISIISQYIAAIGIPARLLLSWAAGLGVVLLTSPYLVFHHGAIGAGISLFLSYAVVLSMLYKLSCDLNIR